MSVENYYDTYWSSEGFFPEATLNPKVKALMEKHISHGTRCIDIGCGDGNTYAGWLQERGCIYCGVDVSSNAIDIARSRGLNATQIDDARSLPFPDNSFDTAVCIEVLEHLFQPQMAAAEIMRVLKPGGMLIATVPNVAYWRRRIDLALIGRWNPIGDTHSVEQPWRDPHIRFFNPGSLSRMLVASGFTEVSVGGHEGAFVRDIPWVGNRLGNEHGSLPYRRVEQFLPSLLGNRLHATAKKSASKDVTTCP